MRRFSLSLSAQCVLVPWTVICAAGQTPAWNHDAGQIGPGRWGSVAPHYATCGTTSGERFLAVGARQTPINIETGKAVPAALPKLSFQYRDSAYEIENTGHVVEVPYHAGSSVRIGSGPTDEYALVQFHFHAPSEHTVDGKQYDGELHLVHTNRLGETLVVGVLLSHSEAIPVDIYDDIMSHAPLKIGKAEREVRINAGRLLPADQAFFMYTGSLTTPPCTEGVRWFVLTNPVAVRTAVIRQLHTIIGGFPGYKAGNNNRPLQAANGRIVMKAE
jgi:carbonic anhydrase